jgi:hypothetical protein
MGDVRGILEFSIVIIVMIFVISIIYRLVEKKRRRDVRKKFRSFTDRYPVIQENLRAVPRVVVPESLEVLLTFTDTGYLGLKAYAIDMSLSGISAKPDFPLKRLPVETILTNVLVVTPINTFVIKEMKTVRIDHQVDKRLMAFHIEKIEEDQFENLKQFMAHLDEFLKKKKEEEPVL